MGNPGLKTLERNHPAAMQRGGSNFAASEEPA
jgi:hypothetical protein